jgi:UDPglucose--hexose-1-phosphate uridylyltransferase
MPETRQDPISGHCVLFAPDRARRPMEFAVEERAPLSTACPFCEGNEAETPPEVWADRAPGSAPNGPGWRVRVVPNKFPALDAAALDGAADAVLDRSGSGFGVHEVLIEGARHAERLTEVPFETARSLLTAVRARLRALGGDPRLAYAVVFKNVGPRAGASIAHGHSQIVATPFVPPAVRQELDAAARAFAQRSAGITCGACAACGAVREALAGGARLVHAGERYAALAPFAPRFPFETWILPAAHASAFGDADDPDLDDLTRVVLAALARLDAVLGRPPLNLVLRTAPFRSGKLDSFDWRLEIYPRFVMTAGLEFGTGVFINAVLPEEAARVLRGAAG